MFSIPTRMTALTLATLVALAIAAPAQAGSGKPTVVEYENCEELGPGAVLCVESRTVLKAVQTPSGNTHMSTRSTIVSRLTSPDCGQETFQATRERSFTRVGKDQVVTTKDHTQIIGTCVEPGVVTECLQTLKAHIANGQVRVDRYEFTCAPVED